MPDKTSPPEPREPAAREWLNENRVKFLTGETVYPYGHSTEKIEYLDEAAMLEAYSAELRLELEKERAKNR